MPSIVAKVEVPAELYVADNAAAPEESTFL